MAYENDQNKSTLSSALIKINFLRDVDDRVHDLYESVFKSVISQNGHSFRHLESALEDNFKAIFYMAMPD